MTDSAGLSAEAQRRAYGKELASNFGADEAPHMVTRVLQRAELAVTELVVDSPPRRVSDLIPRQDAYMVCHHFRGRPGFEYWEEGKAFPVPYLRAGDTCIHHLQLDPAAMIDCPLHSMMWLVPQQALNALAEEANVAHIDELRFDPCVGVDDDIIRQLSAAMLPALRSPEQISRLFADHVALALTAHMAHAYGGMPDGPQLVQGGLAPWQERRATEMLAANLAGDIPLAEVARACGLSVGHFSRAFRKSTGLAPHTWLLQARVEHAMTLLRQPNEALSEIALACGFVDQSHFTRVFVQRVGLTPGAWRRVTMS
ncbi:AraC family transcriptional regulator [Phenylobacterium sp.]|uniref:AraC family transcriptional regulator n=1 Tax=Phenylobacterium sp. TaxID=1871053 RepID=UPI002CF07BBD|nr:AraC family transcriptional regulator [Phenylobacterium sp.]HLZ77215.1 AraC family transcriptional regulator [Phenylobacterium sp.]